MIDRISWVAAASSVALLASAALAAESPQKPEMTPEQKAEMEAYMKAGTPGPQHKNLASRAGTYETRMKSWQAPGQPPMEETGSATRKMMLDGRVLVEEMSSKMMGSPYNGQGMTGYNNVTGKYWSTWTDSMSTGLVVTEGSCDSKNICTYTGSWHDPVTKKLIKSRMTSSWPRPNVEVFEMYAPGKDGKEFKMMEITYTKK
jgi:hypothetical protein